MNIDKMEADMNLSIFRAVHNGCQKQFSDICDLGEFRRFIIPPYSVRTTGKVVESRKKMADAVMRKRGMKQRTISEVTIVF